MSAFDIALVQVAARDDETPAQRLDRGVALLRASARPVAMAMFPELWTVGFSNFDGYKTYAEPLDGNIVTTLAQLARDLNIWLHGGSFVERTADGNLHNTSVLFNPQGDIVATYRKIHLFGYQSRETQILTPGTAPVVVETDLGTFGLSTCYDLRFPELYRAYINAGVDVSLVTSAWPFPRLEHWQILSRARAIENLTWLVACNTCGSISGMTFVGNSVVYNPWGTPVARAGEDETIVYTQIDPAMATGVRERFPAVSDRRDIGAAEWA